MIAQIKKITCHVQITLDDNFRLQFLYEFQMWFLPAQSAQDSSKHREKIKEALDSAAIAMQDAIPYVMDILDFNFTVRSSQIRTSECNVE